MNRIGTLAALGLMFACAALAGEGQPGRPNDQLDLLGVYGSDGKWHRAAGTTGGQIIVGNPEQGWLYYHPSIIQNNKRAPGPHLANNSAAAFPDSSAPLPCVGATRLVLWFYPTFDDSTICTAWGLRLRFHPVQSADSLTTFSRAVRRSGPLATITSATTTIASPQDTIGSVLDFFNPTVYPDSTRRPSEEVVVWGQQMGPRGFGVEFANVGGAYYSVASRILNVLAVGATGIGWAGRDPATAYKVDAYWYR